MPPSIRAEKLAKRYKLGKRQSYGTLRDSLTSVLRAPADLLRLASGRQGADTDTPDFIWALKDISLTIEPGEVVGIVGRNGSGKSTLLKVLSRITEPTSGYAEIHGHVSSLLEVGTGFHPELTGRENILLNGAILGMKHAEIKRRFDEIVAFAEIDPFVDTPVKHYSSGMQMRLAFSVAAHLDSDVLFVDEVLAVGDLAFQRKCMGKMDEVRHDGRTVLLVSHQMNQLRRLCSRCVWVDAGRVQADGAAGEVLGAYEASFRSNDQSSDAAATDHEKDAKFTSWRLHGASDDDNSISVNGPVVASFALSVRKPLRRVSHGIALLSAAGQNMWATAVTGLDVPSGQWTFVHQLPMIPLQPGVYFWQVSVYSSDGMIDLWDCLPALIISTPPLTHYRDEYTGILNLPSTFRLQSTVDESEALQVR